MKKVMTVFLSLALAGTMCIPAFAAVPKASVRNSGDLNGLVFDSLEDMKRSYTIKVNGKNIGIKGISINGTKGSLCTMVPLRAIGEALNFTVEREKGTIFVDKGAIHAEMAIDKDRFIVYAGKKGKSDKGVPLSLGAAPFVKDGVTYVPLSLFGLLLDNKDTIIVKGGKIVIQTVNGGGTEVPNPFINCESLTDASEMAGFDITVPDTIEGYSICAIRAVKDMMIEVIYQNGESKITVRKGAGSKDISGDYNKYAETVTVETGGLKVVMKGDGGIVYAASWTKDGYAFSISIGQGMKRDSVAALAGKVK